MLHATSFPICHHTYFNEVWSSYKVGNEGLFRQYLFVAPPHNRNQIQLSLPNAKYFHPKSHCKCANKLYVLSTNDLQHHHILKRNDSILHVL